MKENKNEMGKKGEAIARQGLVLADGRGHQFGHFVVAGAHRELHGDAALGRQGQLGAHQDGEAAAEDAGQQQRVMALALGHLVRPLARLQAQERDDVAHGLVQRADLRQRERLLQLVLVAQLLPRRAERRLGLTLHVVRHADLEVFQLNRANDRRFIRTELPPNLSELVSFQLGTGRFDLDIEEQCSSY